MTGAMGDRMGNPRYAIGAFLSTYGLLVMLTVYRTGLITVTDQLRSIVISCTGAIFMFYVIAFGMSLFGLYISFLH